MMNTILKKKFFKSIFNLKISYVVIFASLVLWAAYSYNTMSQQIDSDRIYSKLINLSGKQRMLSQKTTLISKRYFETKDKNLKKHLKELIDLMKSDNQFLVDNLPSENMKNIYFKKPFELEKKLNNYFELLDYFYVNEDEKTLKQIEQFSFTLLPTLDSAVNAYEIESTNKTEQLKQKEWFIFLGTILTLVLEAIFIVIPTMRLVNISQAELKDLNNNLEDKVKEQTKVIKEEKDRLNLYLNTINALIISLDKSGNVNMINKNGSEILGYSTNELIGKNWFDSQVLSDEDKESVKRYFEMIIENKIPVDEEYFENNLINKNGDRKLFKWSTSLLKVDGEVVGILSSGIDITKERKQEMIINQQAKNVAMGEMIANIAHQWRQPLSAISTSATGMQLQKEMNSLSDEKFYETTEMINQQAQYLSKTIDDFRNFLRGDVTPICFDVQKNIDEFLTLVNTSIKSHSINIVLDLKDKITIEGYPNQLKQCFINIFNNSKDELDKFKECDRYIFIEDYILGENICISIKDSGGGIPKDVMPRIFEPYFTTKDKNHGTGLGLSMTYDIIVNGMHGHIKVHNVRYKHEGKKLKGVEFIITLSNKNIA